MSEKDIRYQQIWPEELSLALWLAPVSMLLFWSAWAAEVSLLIRLAIGGVALLALLIAGAALIRTSVLVTTDGRLHLRKSIAGLPVTLIHLDAAAIIRVELTRQVTGHSATPRFRMDVVHAKGKAFVVAGIKGGGLKDQAVCLAEALHCPMQKVGD
ncbi:MAG: hypothetical protein CVU69_12665 [Deltaproteobacteria bacterium HGW-Deltaproteobacteria-4]|nr:MAG: hypothetical protein CVU69_12665 [Deltaproteobacteria bacterium HGW-Deltaproteobacteria-4]